MEMAVTVTDLTTGNSVTTYFGSRRKGNAYVEWILSQNRPVHIHTF